MHRAGDAAHFTDALSNCRTSDCNRNRLLYKSLFTENTVASKEKKQRKDKYNEGGTATNSMTVVDTWYWKKIYIINVAQQIKFKST